MRTFVLSMAIGLLAAGTAIGGECGVACCEAASCGQDCRTCPQCGCKMVCTPICTVKEIKKTVWNVKCEPFCAPLPGFCRACKCGDPACGGCDDEKCRHCCNPCAVEKAKCQVPPKCGPVRCKKILEKKEVVCKVPSYTCVRTCPHCGCGSDSSCGAGSGASPPKTEKAPPPSKTTQNAPLPPVLGVSFVK